MGEYRDERETLRRRVTELERELAARDESEAAGEDRLTVLRRERDEARRERDALLDERAALERRLARADRPGAERWRAYALAGAVVLAFLFTALRSRDPLSIAVELLAAVLVVGSVLFRATRPTERRVRADPERAAASAERTSTKRRARARVRVEVERQDAAVAAHRERAATAQRAKRRKRRA